MLCFYFYIYFFLISRLHLENYWSKPVPSCAFEHFAHLWPAQIHSNHCLCPINIYRIVRTKSYSKTNQFNKIVCSCAPTCNVTHKGNVCRQTNETAKVRLYVYLNTKLIENASMRYQQKNRWSPVFWHILNGFKFTLYSGNTFCPIRDDTGMVSSARVLCVLQEKSKRKNPYDCYIPNSIITDRT